MHAWPQPELPTQWTGRHPPFVGRRHELDVLENLWPEAVRGARQVLLVGGDPGTGKSRLAAEAALALQKNDVSVLVGSCTSAAGLPFDPFVEPVRVLLSALDAGRLELDASDGRSDDESRDLLRLLTHGSTLGSGPAAGAVAPVAFDVVVSALEAASRIRPVLLVLEDLQWAGESALGVLRYVIDRTAELRALFILTHRSSPTDRSTLLSRFMSGVVPLDGVHRVDLMGLDVEDVAEYIALADDPPDGSRDGSPPGSPTGPPAGPPTHRPAEDRDKVATVLFERTGGNPFVLREVWRDLRQHGGVSSLFGTVVSVPESLRSVVDGRLANLTTRQRDLLFLGAVIGDEYGSDLVRAADVGASHVEADGARLREVFGALEACEATGLVDQLTGRPGHWRWVHALARQAVLDSRGSFELAGAHARVGRALEEGFPAEPSRTQRLAHHFVSAGGLESQRKAAGYLEAAARTASDRLAHSDAAALYEQAATHADTATTRDRLLVGAARAHNLAGHMGRSLQLNEEVARSVGSEHRLAAAVGFEAASWRLARPGDEAAALLTAAIDAETGDGSDPRVIRARGSLARAHAFAGRPDNAREQGRLAVRLARRSGDESLLASTLQRTLGDSVGLADLPSRRERSKELADIAARRGDFLPSGQASTFRAIDAYTVGDAEGFLEAREDLSRTVRATGQPFWTWTALVWHTTTLILNCDFAAAADCLQESNRLEKTFEGPEGGNDGPRSLQMFMLRRETGGLEFARALVERVAVDNLWRPGAVAMGTELGMRDLVRTALHDALERDLPWLRASSSWPASLGFLAEGAAWLADPDAMRALLPEAEAYAGLNLAGAEFLVVHGSADRLIGLLRSGLGLDGADECFSAAAAMDRRMHSPLHVATTLAMHAAHRRASGESATRIEEVAGPARAMADSHHLPRVLRLLGRDAVVSKRGLPDGLTVREVEVLRLVGRGRSNRDIARDLFISEHTAANHVRSILMKTQCANRTSAAHYAMRHGLLDEAVGVGSDDRDQ